MLTPHHGQYSDWLQALDESGTVDSPERQICVGKISGAHPAPADRVQGTSRMSGSMSMGHEYDQSS